MSFTSLFKLTKIPLCVVLFFIALNLIPKLYKVQAQTTSFTFTAAGDIGASSKTNVTLPVMASQNTAFNIVVGDLSYSEKTPETAWCDYVKNYYGPDYPFELLAGNHEDDDGPDGWIGNFTSCLPDKLFSMGSYGKEYYFDYPSTAPLARFILISPSLQLDGETYSYGLGTPRYTWLSNTLDSTRAGGIKWIIVGMHKNCITMGAKSCEIGVDLMNLLMEKKVDLIIQGHDHNYQRSKQLELGSFCSSLTVGSYNQNCVSDDGADNLYTKNRGPVIVISGTPGRTNYDVNTSDPEAGYFASWYGDSSNSVNGFSKFTVSENQIDVSFVPTVGTYTDQFSIVETGYSPTPTPTPIPTQTFTVPVSEDATIRLDSPDSNFGALTSLEVDSSPVQNFLLKFFASGINGRKVVSSKLKLYNTNASSAGGNYNKVSSNSWSENNITWNNAPPAESIVASLGSVNPNNWYELDVTNYVTSDGVYSFRVTSSSSDGADYTSKEGGVNKPYLQITVEDTSQTPTPTPGPTTTPTPTITPTPVPTPTPISTPTPMPPTTVTISPDADATIRQSSPNNNYGASTRLETDASPIKSFLLKFNLNGLGSMNVTGAKLRLYNTNRSNGSGGTFYLASDSNWSESGVTWNNAPTKVGTGYGTLGKVVSGTWYEVDVTSAIVGEGLYSFRIDSPSTDGADYSSKESGSTPPELVITLK